MRDWQKGSLVVLGLGLGYLGAVSALPPGVADDVATGAQAAVMTGSAAVIWARSRHQPREAVCAWRAAAASSGASAVIFMIWLAYQVRGEQLPVPSLADLPFYLAVALLVLAAIRLPQADQKRTAAPQLLLDGLIVATSLLVISWRLVIGPTLAGVDGWTARTAVLLSYPLADVAAATAALIVASRSRSDSRWSLAFLILGILAFTAGDTAYGMLSLAGTFHPAHPVTTLWFVGYPLIAVGAGLRVDPANADHETARATRLRVLLLTAPVAVALALTAFQDVGDGSTVLTMGLVGLVLLRQMIAMFAELQLRADLERQVQEQTDELRRQVYLDPVTGLGNRPLLRHRALSHEQRGLQTSLLLIDLDGFKAVNDSLGHAAGDAVLVHVGARLGNVVRPTDTVVRLGGDEFAILLPQTGRRDALVVADRALKEIHRPLEIKGTEVEVSGSIGIAVGAADFDADELLRQADLAMYEAKAAGGLGVSVFEPQMLDLLNDRVRAEQETRCAVRNGQIVVYYQPIVSVATGRVTGVEALARWNHPERGLLPPSEFIEACERTGTIVELGQVVLREACADLRTWRASWPGLTVAVNVSQRELLDPELPSRVREALRLNQLPPSALHLEITETVVAADTQLADTLNKFARMGVRLSIDDFGTGHSSLSRLRALPVHRLKIDRSFVQEVDRGGAPLLASVLLLGRSLGLVTVAEGVETHSQLEFLARNGCSEIQGYLISRPVAAPHVAPLLSSTHIRIDGPPTADLTLDRLVERVVNAPAASLEPVQSILEQIANHLRLDSTFITTVLEGVQVVRWAHNRGELAVPLGLHVPWKDTLCRRLFEDGDHFRSGLLDSDKSVPAARELGISTFISVPIYATSGELIGTLCGASRGDVEVTETEMALVRLIAQVLCEPVSSIAVDGVSSVDGVIAGDGASTEPV